MRLEGSGVLQRGPHLCPMGAILDRPKLRGSLIHTNYVEPFPYLYYTHTHTFFVFVSSSTRHPRSSSSRHTYPHLAQPTSPGFLVLDCPATTPGARPGEASRPLPIPFSVKIGQPSSYPLLSPPVRTGSAIFIRRGNTNQACIEGSGGIMSGRLAS